jgi:hypothetical protein
MRNRIVLAIVAGCVGASVGCSADASRSEGAGTGALPTESPVAAADPAVLDAPARSVAMGHVLSAAVLTAVDARTMPLEEGSSRVIVAPDLDALETIDMNVPPAREHTLLVDSERHVVEGIDSEIVGRELYKRWHVRTHVDETAHSISSLALGYNAAGKLSGFVSIWESGGKVVVESGPYVASGVLRGLNARGMDVFTRSSRVFDQEKNSFADNTARGLDTDLHADGDQARPLLARDVTSSLIVPLDVNWLNCISVSLVFVSTACAMMFSCSVGEVGTAGVATGICASLSIGTIGTALGTVSSCTP